MEGIKVCRSCKSDVLADILSLGNMYLSDFRDDDQKPAQYPLDLILCKKCFLLQLKHTTPPSALYHERYGFKSGINNTIKEDLRSIVMNALLFCPPKDGDLVLSIGENDGTLLSFYPETVFKIGVEPIKKLAKECEKHADIVINDFWSYEAYEKKLQTKKAKIITIISCFYDMPDPNKFVSDVAKVLADDGICIIQQNYVVGMLTQNAFDNICFKPDTIILGDNKHICELGLTSSIISARGSLVGVKQTMKRDYKGEMIKITPMYLDPIITTPEHPILIVKKEFLRHPCGQLKKNLTNYITKWVDAKNIKRGDWVVMPKLTHNTTPVNLDLTSFNYKNKNWRRGLCSLIVDEEIAWMMGLYVAEGHTNRMIPGNEAVCFTLNKKETYYAERVAKIFKKIGYKTSIKIRKENNSLDIRVYCTALGRAFKEWFKTKASVKQIPDFIMFASKEIKVAFLQGLFAGDGYIKGNKIHFHTASRVLALQTQLLIGSLGGMVGISYVKPYPRVIRGKPVISGDSWQLRGSSKRLGEIFGYKYQGKEIKHIIENDNNILIPIKKTNIEYYKGTVNNIETEDNTYLVSNAIVHNCHEHLEYYSLLSLEPLLQRHGLEVYHVELNDINGGSFRTYIRHKTDKPVNDSVLALRQAETSFHLDDPEVYSSFSERVNENAKKLYDFIEEKVKEGKKVYCYGASTRGGTLMQYAKLSNRLISAAVERNPEKWGKKIASLGIPIISEEQARKDKPDYFLILPWFFAKEFKEREKDYINSGGKFLIPLPNFEVYPNE